ncbi:hypothetical protein OY671_009991, partial [Metschnikowia pulcherrima]
PTSSPGECNARPAPALAPHRPPGSGRQRAGPAAGRGRRRRRRGRGGDGRVHGRAAGGAGQVPRLQPRAGILGRRGRRAIPLESRHFRAWLDRFLQEAAEPGVPLWLHPQRRQRVLFLAPDDGGPPDHAAGYLRTRSGVEQARRPRLAGALPAGEGQALWLSGRTAGDAERLSGIP